MDCEAKLKSFLRQMAERARPTSISITLGHLSDECSELQWGIYFSTIYNTIDIDV